jgi:hypothetical protein
MRNVRLIPSTLSTKTPPGPRRVLQQPFLSSLALKKSQVPSCFPPNSTILHFPSEPRRVSRSFRPCVSEKAASSHTHLRSQMCYVILNGSTKHLLCGHISGLKEQNVPCNSSHCLASGLHQWPCGAGFVRGCPACAYARAACSSHHTCQDRTRVEERYRQTSNSFCRRCSY